MARIFISYKRVDKDKVFKIKDQIESLLGIKCWIDVDGIECDAQFKSVIINAINKCEVVLFMYSKEHYKIEDFETDWTFRELGFAVKKKKKIVFVNIDGSALSDVFAFDFGNKQQIDGRSNNAIEKLCNDLAKWLKIEKPVPKLPTSVNSASIWKKYKSFILSGCIILISAIAVSLYYTIFNHETAQTNTADQVIPLASVDLALPSGTKWANMNVGAKRISDFGTLYSWGETKSKNSFMQNCYKSITRTNIAGSRHDVSTTTLGKGWQTPSEKDFIELLNHCKWTWSSRFGHTGYVVTGKNGNSIFLPASGWSCSSTIEHRNRFGYYWCSNKEDNTFARNLSFGNKERAVKSGYLYYGRTIRAIKK